MSHTNRTNPAYAFLAYRRAILEHITHILATEYVCPVDGEPNSYIFSDDVFKTDAQVPIEDIRKFLEELQEESASVSLEMNKFEFRLTEPVKEPVNEPKATKNHSGKRSSSTSRGHS